ncbi:MAG TPA: TolC family protein, partial [Flammeovirgaceae bacterium]|nr:TolC family protein [Flammeovirgaceae bacterium]
AGLKLTVPVFDGLRKHYNIQQRKIELEQVHNNFDYLENQINLEIQQARVAYENGVANMKTQLENMKIAEEVYQITKTKYQQGVGSNIEVINADAEYKEAQTNYFQALYQALIAKVEYEKALGLLN